MDVPGEFFFYIGNRKDFRRMTSLHPKTLEGWRKE